MARSKHGRKPPQISRKQSTPKKKRLTERKVPEDDQPLFSLQQSARTTKATSTLLGANMALDMGLRYQRVQFISAGNYDANKLIDVNASLKSQETSHVVNEHTTLSFQAEASPVVDPSSHTQTNSSRNIEDLHQAEESSPIPLPRSPSPCSSDSSGGVRLTTINEEQGWNFQRDVHDNSSTKFANTGLDTALIESGVSSIKLQSSVEKSYASSHDSILEDYLKNLKENGEISETSYGKDEKFTTQSEVETGAENVAPNKLTNESETNAYDNQSASESYGEIERILSERTQNGEIQYLVVFEGSEIREAKWVPEVLLKGFSALNEFMIEQFVSIQSKTFRSQDYDAIDELDSSTDDESETESDDLWETATFKKGHMKSILSQYNAQNAAKHSNVQDWDIDDNLEERLQSLWTNDRRKKAEKKRARELLRAQGLLGAKNKKRIDQAIPDIRSKYPDFISREDLRKELHVFLASTLPELALPVMGASQRRGVHVIAHKLGLKSDSSGKEGRRYITIVKTKKTLELEDVDWDALKLGPTGGRSSRNAATKPVRKDYAVNRLKATGYRDGEIVGAAAPKLGADNRGHAMMEKMGWTNGKALGAVGNQGMLDPVSHIVKTTRTGLG